MLDPKEALSSIQKAVRDVLNNQSLVITLESKLMDDLGLESIDLLDVSSELENTTGKELDFKEVADFVKTRSGGAASLKNVKVQDLVEYLAANS